MLIAKYIAQSNDDYHSGSQGGNTTLDTRRNRNIKSASADAGVAAVLIDARNCNTFGTAAVSQSRINSQACLS